MSLSPQEQFVVEAFRLSKLSHPHWDAFLKAFSAYASQQCEIAVKSSPAEALVSHGRAQAMLGLRDEFATLEEVFRKIEAREHRR